MIGVLAHELLAISQIQQPWMRMTAMDLNRPGHRQEDNGNQRGLGMCHWSTAVLLSFAPGGVYRLAIGVPMPIAR